MRSAADTTNAFEWGISLQTARMPTCFDLPDTGLIVRLLMGHANASMERQGLRLQHLAWERAKTNNSRRDLDLDLDLDLVRDREEHTLPIADVTQQGQYQFVKTDATQLCLGTDAANALKQRCQDPNKRLENEGYYSIAEKIGNGQDLIDPLNGYLNVRMEDASEKKSAFLQRMLDALRAMDQSDVVHADIKPENIGLRRSDDIATATLLDFGSAKQRSAGLVRNGVICANYERGSCGTLVWAAPETLEQEAGTEPASLAAQSDWWSMAMVFAILCRHPFGHLVLNRMDRASEDPTPNEIRALDEEYGCLQDDEISEFYRDDHTPEGKIFNEILYPMARASVKDRKLPTNENVARCLEFL